MAKNKEPNAGNRPEDTDSQPGRVQLLPDSQEMQCSPSAVGYTLQKYRRTNSLEDKPRSGCPRVSSARNDRILICMCRENLRMTSQEPLINERQRLAWHRWAQAHKNWTARNWKKILWSDESSFQLYPPPDNVRVHRRPGEALSPACTVPTVQHGGDSIMVWGCMSAAGVGHLTVCDGTLNSAKYCAILETHMLPSARALFHRGQNWMFDSASCHTSSASQTKPKNLEELKAVIQEEWDKLTPQQREKLVGNTPDRIRALLRANGRTTKYSFDDMMVYLFFVQC
uniref:Tc1-like transposase DDE domain-containing protein n=1 Tax=Lates calcarifer TaxID=8187 RepID=A0A4W6D530_LATCA